MGQVPVSRVLPVRAGSLRGQPLRCRPENALGTSGPSSSRRRGSGTELGLSCSLESAHSPVSRCELVASAHWWVATQGVLSRSHCPSDPQSTVSCGQNHGLCQSGRAVGGRAECLLAWMVAASQRVRRNRCHTVLMNFVLWGGVFNITKHMNFFECSPWAVNEILSLYNK